MPKKNQLGKPKGPLSKGYALALGGSRNKTLYDQEVARLMIALAMVIT